MVKEVNDREEACKHLLEKDIKEYEDARSSLKENGLDACTSLVKKLGYQTRNDELEEKETVVCTPKKELKPLVLKDISRGRFSFIFPTSLSSTFPSKIICSTSAIIAMVVPSLKLLDSIKFPF